MRILAIETATEACSVALFEDGKLLARDHKVLGRGHAERLVPMIEALPDKGLAERILVSVGPGSFTGVRIGIATARALGFAWSAQVLGYPTLALVAAIEQVERKNEPLTVCMNGGHGEWFLQNFAKALPQNPVRSLAPADAAEACRHNVIVGNRAHELAGMYGAGAKTAIERLPDAGGVLSLPQDLFVADLSPIYGREPDAKLPGS